MAGNTKAIDTLISPEAIKQVVDLKAESASLRVEMSELLEVAVKLNATLGGSTPATFSRNAKASTEATDKLIQNSNRQIEIEGKKAAAQEAAYNKYLQLLSKQQAERDKADAKEIAAAEKKAAKLAAIQAESARKAAVQFPTSTPGYSPVTSEPDTPAVKYEPIITGEENMQIAMVNSTEAIAAENASLLEQKEVLDGLSVSQRANLELLLALQVEREENTIALKALNVEDAASGERLVFLTAEQFRLKTAIQQTTLTLNQQTKQMLAEDTSGAQMQARLDELRVAIGNLNEAELQNIEIGGVWLAEAEQLDIAIKQLRGSTGDATKNVGAYTTATQIADKVSAQFIRQLIRMAAQFLLITVVIGAATWLFDFIKNLDIFTGRLDQATQNLKAFNEVQKSAAADAGQIVGKYRILSDTIKDLNISYEDRLRAATELKKLFPEELEHSTAQAIANGTEAASLDKLSDSVVKLAKAKAAASEIEKIEGEITALQMQRDKVNWAKSDNLNATANGNGFGRLSVMQQLLVSQSGVPSKKDLNKIFKQDADTENADIAAQVKVKENTIKLLEQYGGLQKEAEAIEGKPTKTPKAPKEKDTANTDLLEYNRIRLEESKKINKSVLDNEDNSYDTRMVALDKYLADSRALIKNSEAIIDADTHLRAQQRINMKLELANKAKDIDIEAANERARLDKDELEKRKKAISELLALQKDGQQEQLEDLSQGAIVAAQNLEDARDKVINAKNLEYAEGKITEKQYNRDLLAINDEYNIQRLNQELAVQQAILAIQQATRDRELAAATARGATPDELSKINSDASRGITGTNNKIASITGQLSNAKSKQKVDQTKDGKNAAAEARKNLEDALGYVKDITGEVQDLVDAGYENQISKLEKIGDKIQENADIEKAAVDRSLDTQSNKARASAIIDAQTAAQQKALQKQIADEKTKQARADKVAAIAEIILNTAIGASKVVGQTGIFGLSLVPIVIALGALQLAKVVATPIPQFAKGTPIGGHKGGYAIVGDGGGPERITEPGKTPYYSPGVSTMMNLPRGTIVEPYKMLPETPNWTQTRSDNAEVVSGLGRIERAVSGQGKSRGTRLSGWVEAQRQADAWQSVRDKHFR